MFDPDNQDYSPGGGSPGSNYYGPDVGGLGGASGEGIKKFLPIIIAIIIVIAIGYFAFSYFASQQTITINLVSSDGNPIEGRLTAKDASQNPVKLNPSGSSSSFTATIGPGDYRLSASAEGYKTTSRTITIPLENGYYDFNLTKDLRATLTAEATAAQLFAGQSAQLHVQVINNGASFTTADVTATATLPLQVTNITPVQTITGAQTVDFNVSVKTGTVLTEAKTLTVTFKIKGSDISSNPIQITVLPAVAASSLTTPVNLSNTTLTAGEQKTIPIQIKNGSKSTPIKDLRFEIVADPAGEQDYETKIDWFAFADPSTEGKNIKVLDNLDPNASATITLYVKPPIGAIKGEEFKGKIVVSSNSLTGTKAPIIMDYIVATEKKVDIQFVTPEKDIVITCTNGVCNNRLWQTGQAYLINNGNVAVGPIKISILSQPPTTANCRTYLQQFSTLDANSDTIDKLEAKDKTPLNKATIVMKIIAPQETPNNDNALCKIGWQYSDPLNPENGLVQGEPYIISITKVIK